METPPGVKADGAVNDGSYSLHGETSTTHVEPTQLTLQADVRRLRFGADRAETEIARSRDSHAGRSHKAHSETRLSVESVISAYTY